MLKEKNNQECQKNMTFTLVVIFIIFVLIIYFPFLLIIFAFFIFKSKMSLGKILRSIGFYECFEAFKDSDKKNIEKFVNALEKINKNKQKKYSNKNNEKDLYLDKLNINKEKNNKKLDFSKTKNNFSNKTKSKFFTGEKSVFSNRKSIFDDYESVMDKF